jgi:cytochrome c-type biogenesis protein
MEFDVSLLGALFAGVLSFVSPCVLPLVPPYLGFLAGASLDQLVGDPAHAGANERRIARRVLFAAFAFVLGFATVFVALGASAAAISQALIAYSDWLAKLAGIVIVMLGLHFTGVLRLPLLNRDARLHLQRRPAGLIGAYIVGLAFAFGWSPCVGPVLATILTIAASRESASEGALLLAAYAAGIGIPFLAAAMFVRPFLRLMRGARRWIRVAEIATGVLLIATGAMIFAGSFTDLGFWLQRMIPALSEIG